MLLRVERRLLKSRAPQTKANYLTGWSRFVDYMRLLGMTAADVGSVVDKDVLTGFIDYLDHHLQLSKEAFQQSWYGFLHYAKTLDLTLEDKNEWVQLNFDGARRSAPESIERTVRIPLTGPPLMKYLISIDRSTFRGVMTGFTLVFGFLTAERPGVYALREVMGVMVHDLLRIRNVTVKGKDEASVFFPRTKVASNVRVYFMRTGNVLCVLFWLDILRKIQEKAGRFGDYDHLLANPDEPDEPLTYLRLLALLKEVGSALGLKQPDELKGYALRRGAIQTAYMLKAPLAVLKSVGRHKSSAYKVYIVKGKVHMRWWQKLAIKELKPSMSWFGYIPRDRALRLKVDNVEQWDAEVHRGSKRWS